MLFSTNECQELHNRNISISTYLYDADAIALEGRLTDNRFVDTYSLFGKFRPAGIVHGMRIQMIVRVPRIIIEDIQVEMKTVPDPKCPAALDSLLDLKGEVISSGFTAKVQQVAGGRKGCAHLVALIRAMASAAIQGAYSMMARKPPEERKLTMKGMKTAIDSCHLWRSDGPMVQDLLKRLDEDRKEDE